VADPDDAAFEEFAEDVLCAGDFEEDLAARLGASALCAEGVEAAAA